MERGCRLARKARVGARGIAGSIAIGVAAGEPSSVLPQKKGRWLCLPVARARTVIDEFGTNYSATFALLDKSAVLRC